MEQNYVCLLQFVTKGTKHTREHHLLCEISFCQLKITTSKQETPLIDFQKYPVDLLRLRDFQDTLTIKLSKYVHKRITKKHGYNFRVIL